MSALSVRNPVGRKKLNLDRERVELRADPEWIRRIYRQATRLGISVSAYIRQAVTLRLERDEADEPKQDKKRSKE